MDRDTRRLLLIVLCLVGGILLIYGLWYLAETGRPELLEVRVVSASSSDPVFREGARVLEPGQQAELAVALKIRKRGRGEHWIAPVDQLELDGALVEHQRVDSWPEKDRLARVFWFSIESSRLGGDISRDDAVELLSYERFLLPDAGRAWRIEAPVEPRNDDFLSDLTARLDRPAGTLRFYARVEIVASMTQVRPFQAISATRDDPFDDPLVPTVTRSLVLADGLSELAGQLFNLSGFEPVEGALLDGATIPGLGRSFIELVRARLVTSSRSFAAMAIVGAPTVEDERLRDLGAVSVTENGVTTRRGSLEWQRSVIPGDLLELDGHWMVLLGDSGDGVLGLDDLVAHCWRRPPEIRPLDEVLGEEDSTLRHYRALPDEPPPAP